MHACVRAGVRACVRAWNHSQEVVAAHASADQAAATGLSLIRIPVLARRAINNPPRLSRYPDCRLPGNASIMLAANFNEHRRFRLCHFAR